MATAAEQVCSAPAAKEKKIELRRLVLEHLRPAKVFEAFSGLGEMWEGAWQLADDYTDCDIAPLKLDEPMARMCCDNTLALRALDLQRFNVFDFDAFGSPWNCALILASRRKWKTGEQGAIVLTDGSSMKIRYGGLPHAMANLIGCSPKCSAKNAIAANMQRLALQGFARRAGVRITKLWRFDGNGSGKGAQTMTYTAACFEGN